MSDIEASHGPWCNSKTYPTRCKYCGERVFFFTCDHGCKVFFNELGWPWPEHRCPGYLIAQYGKEVIEQGLAVMMMTPGIEIGRHIDHEYTDKLKEHQDRPFVSEITRCDPYEGCATQEQGIVREMIEQVDIFHRLKISEDSTMGVALLRPFVGRKVSQITIHTNALTEQDCYSFTFLVDCNLLKKKGIIKGDFVTCKLRSLAIPGREVIWICDGLTSAFEYSAGDHRKQEKDYIV